MKKNFLLIFGLLSFPFFTFSQNCPSNIVSGGNGGCNGGNPSNCTNVLVLDDNLNQIGSIDCSSPGNSGVNCGSQVVSGSNNIYQLNLGSTGCLYGDSGGLIGFLSVGLLSYDVVKSNLNGMLEVQWSTATEVNNDHFVIYKSEDGINWKELTTIDGAGTSNSQLDYKFIDNQPNGHTIVYYRLVQFDFDGTSTDLGIRSFSTDVSAEVISRINLMGQKVDENYTGIVILQLNDGSVKKTNQ